jgi:hypothetical protein
MLLICTYRYTQLAISMSVYTMDFPRRIVILDRITVRYVPDRGVPESFPWTMHLLVGQYVLCTKRPDRHVPTLDRLQAE